MSDQFKELATGMKPFSSMETLKVFMLKWGVFTFFFLTLSLYILPWNKTTLHLSLKSSLWLIENLFWLILSVLSSTAVYLNSFPEQRLHKLNIVLGVILLFLFSLIFINEAPLLEQDLTEQLQAWRGICTILIGICTFIYGFALLSWAKKGATTQPKLTGLWAAISGSALGCFLMQVICIHENSLHLIIWHFIPLAGFSYLGRVIAKKVLRW